MDTDRRGNRLREQARLCGLTQKEIGDQVGLRQTTISALFNGLPAREATVEKVAEALGLYEDHVFAESRRAVEACVALGELPAEDQLMLVEAIEALQSPDCEVEDRVLLKSAVRSVTKRLATASRSLTA